MATRKEQLGWYFFDITILKVEMEFLALNLPRIIPHVVF